MVKLNVFKKIKELKKRLFGKKDVDKTDIDEPRDYVIHFWKDMKCEDYKNAVEYKITTNNINEFCRNVQLFLNVRDNVNGICGWHFWVDDKVPNFEFKDKNGVFVQVQNGFMNFKDIIPENDDLYNQMVKQN